MRSAKTKFVITHLFFSLCVALCVVVLIFVFWYPLPLNKATGVTHIFLMMLAIDIVLGPFFTWLVYKEGKKTLVFDLVVIILIQIAALGYGIYNIAQGRPVWIVYSVDRFDLVRNNELYTKNIHHAQKKYQQTSWLTPQFAAIEFSKDQKQRNADMFDEVLGGVDISQRPERYVAIDKAKVQIQKRAQDLVLLSKYNDLDSVKKILNRYPKANAFVPLKANAVDMTVLIHKETAEVIEIVDLRPWKLN